MLSFNDKYMMLFHDRRYVRLKSRRRSCIPRELWDREFDKFAAGSCIYCNGEYDDFIPSTLGLFVKPSSRFVSGRWLASAVKSDKRKGQGTLNGWKVQKRTSRKVREVSPNSIYKRAVAEVENCFVGA